MKNIEQVLLFQIDKTSKMSKIFSQRAFDKLDFGLTVDQWILLKIIHEHPEISQQELANKSLRDPASITRTLDLLTKKGFTERNQILGNRRKYSITLSEAGLKFVENNMKTIIEHRENSVRGLTKNEIETVTTILKKMQANMI